MPLSLTCTSTDLYQVIADTVTDAPDGEHLMALDRRFTSTCTILSSSHQAPRTVPSASSSTFSASANPLHRFEGALDDSVEVVVAAFYLHLSGLETLYIEKIVDHGVQPHHTALYSKSMVSLLSSWWSSSRQKCSWQAGIVRFPFRCRQKVDFLSVNGEDRCNRSNSILPKPCQAFAGLSH